MDNKISALQQPLKIVRPYDFLFLTFEFENLRLELRKGDTPLLLRQDASAPAFILVTFPPQSIGEEAFSEVADGLAPGPSPAPTTPPVTVAPTIPVRGEFAGPSFVRFELPDSFKSAPFTLESLLDLWHKQSKPATLIEAPDRLFIQPEPGTAWAHSAIPVWNRAKTRAELWHTRLGVLLIDPSGQEYVDERQAEGRQVRAIRQSGESVSAGVKDSSLPLDRSHRDKIMQASKEPPLPAIQVNRLMLSALGAWLNVDQSWDYQGTPIENWQHRMTLGRDHYVRIADPGYLYPFGHRASLVTITERKFEDYNSARGALLRQRKYVVVREPELEYKHADFPFKSVRIKTLVTPDLAPPSQSQVPGLDPNGVFFPRILLNGDTQIIDFLFAFEATDKDGRPAEFHLPLLFVSDETAKPGAGSIQQQIQQGYNDSTDLGKSRRNIVLGGQLVAYAPATKEGDAALESDAILVCAALDPGNTPPWRPKLQAANVRVPAVNSLTGTNDPLTIDYFSNPDSNKGGVFAKVHTPTASVNIDTEKAGGLTAPNFSITGLSNRLGPVGGELSEVAGGAFDPSKFFDGFFPTILGGVKLTDILDHATLPDIGELGTAPPPVPRLVRNVWSDRIETTLEWQPVVKSSGIFNVDGDPKSTLTLKTTLTAPLTGGAPTYTIKGTLSKFTIKLLPGVAELIHLPFKELQFITEQGKKTDVTADLGTLKFVGPLEFVNELARLIPTDGFKDPPSVDVTAEGVDVGYSLGLPTIAMGYFSLQNVSLSSGLHLPFVGDPASLRFAFCERHNPFLLTVSAIGGGGFFGIELTLKGIQRVEFALEFGGNIALDIGVASGGVSIMAGIYYEKNGDDVKLTGFVRVAGAVQVLGIVCISVEFYLALEYDPGNKQAWGVATLTVEIEVLFFSKDVSMTARREFPKGGDPTFKDLVPDLATWQAYCDSFADY